MATSAGILMYRVRGGGIEVLLVHPGGPFWSRKDEGAWSIPKGLPEPGEDDAAAARREFAEELGRPAEGALHPLGSIRQAGGKTVVAFALEGDLDAGAVRGGGRVTLEWPRGSGRLLSHPEIDRAGWFALPQAREKLLAGQRPLLDRLEQWLSR